jgi:hypothetical protein
MARYNVRILQHTIPFRDIYTSTRYTVEPYKFIGLIDSLYLLTEVAAQILPQAVSNDISERTPASGGDIGN